MADCISREEARNGIYNCPTKIDADGYIWVRTSDVAHMIDDIPAADVVEVVRCVDCRYDHACLTQQFVEETSRIPFDRNEFFCSDGIRGSDNGESK